MKENIKAVACPKCEADRGDDCIRPNGKRPPFHGWAHKERVMLYRYGLTPEEVSRAAQESMANYIEQLSAADGRTAPFECCGIPFCDMAAIDRHISRGHVRPIALGLTPRHDGWSSR